MGDLLTRKEYLLIIRNAYGKATTTTSKVCRYIVFAVIGAIWVLFQQNGLFEFQKLPSRALGLLILYIIIDLSQYFTTAILYMRVHHKRNKIKKNKMVRSIHSINKILFFIFLIKISYLLLLLCIFGYFIFFKYDTLIIN